MTIAAKLKQLNIALPEPSQPAARYTNVVRVGNLLFVAGKGCRGIDAPAPRGKLGLEYTTDQGYDFARETGLEILAVLQDYAGTLDAIKRVVKIQGFVNASPDFTEHHKVLNGCSELMVEVFGDAGIHARSVLGAVSLRDNLPIVVDSIFEIKAQETAN